MSYAFVEDIAASWEQYERFAAALEGPAPAGLILHAAGRTDEGVRIIEVWESAEAWRRFAGDSRSSANARLADAPRYLREFTPTHLVIAGDRPDIRTEGTHA